MANHKLHGEWRAFSIDPSGNASRANGILYLRMTNKSTGKVEKGSNHDGNEVTGAATTTGNKIKISIEETNSQNIRTFTGLLISENTVAGQDVMIMAGGYRDRPQVVGGGPTPVTTAAQEEGTWVATKP